MPSSWRRNCVNLDTFFQSHIQLIRLIYENKCKYEMYSKNKEVNMIYTKLYNYTQKNFIDLRKKFIKLTKEKEFNKKLYLDFCMNYKYNDRKNYIINIRSIPLPREEYDKQLDAFLDFLKKHQAIEFLSATQEEIKKITLKPNKYPTPYKDYLYKSILQDLLKKWFIDKSNKKFIKEWYIIRKHEGLTKYEDIISFLINYKKQNHLEYLNEF